MLFSKNTKAIFIAIFNVFFLFFLPKPPCPGLRHTRALPARVALPADKEI
jgi:hypothetical protein